MRDALSPARDRPSLRIVGIGNAYRTDDAVGLQVARALRRELPPDVEVVEREGEPTSLLDAWSGADAVWVVDAVSSGSAPGTIHRVDATSEGVPAGFARTSTHHFGLPDAVELGRAVGRLPGRLVVYGIEGASFDTGDTLTPSVAEAAPAAVEAIRREVLAELRAR